MIRVIWFVSVSFHIMYLVLRVKPTISSAWLCYAIMFRTAYHWNLKNAHFVVGVVAGETYNVHVRLELCQLTSEVRY